MLLNAHCPVIVGEQVNHNNKPQ